LFAKARVLRDKGGFELDVEATFEPGITVVFGPSGSGKSTLLNVIAGLLRPLRGRVTMGDDVWLDSDRGVEKPVHQRHVAFVFQSLGLFPHMTGLENVAFGIDRALSKQARRARARESLARFRASHLADRRPRTFSGGEGQRVALARAFAMAPRVMLLDEPFSALEQSLRAEFAPDLKAFASELGIPVVHVTHDLAEAIALGDRAMRMQRGRVVAVGAPRETLEGAP